MRAWGVPEIQYRTGSYWYEFESDECVLCGRGHTHRYRKYGPPPPLQERYHYSQYVCGEHFV